MAQVTVAKWGDTLAVRLPEEIVVAARLHDGQCVEIAAEDNRLLICHPDSESVVDSWFAGKTPAEWHAEYAAAAAEVDWGPDVGREIIPE